MRTKWCTCFLGMLLALSAAAFEITSNWVIVSPDGATEVERFAAEEIQKYIQQSTGMTLKMASSGSPAIIVRKGEYAPEEWAVSRTKEGDLLVSGGFPRGVLYGAYEFIEKGLGCRFLAIGNEYIPKKSTLTLPDDISLKGTPAMELRYLYVGDDSVWKQMQPFLAKLKQNGLPAEAKYGWKNAMGEPRDCHTYYIYSADFPKDKPELFSLHTDGTRLHAVNPSGPGQVCKSNPETRRLFLEKLRMYVKQDRESAAKNGMPPPTVYDISANDNEDKCVCQECLAREKKYGAYSGVLLEFINYLADEIKKEYPDVRIQTFAYLHTELPPKGIQPSENVIVRLAQLGYEFNPQKIKRDVMRPLEHPNNKLALQMLKDWRACAKNLSIWDYWIMFKDPHSSPYTNVSAIGSILKEYHKLGIQRVFVETELEIKSILNFIDLRYYVAAKLMADPSLDEKQLIGEFMDLTYGPAAKPMKEYLDYLETRMAEETRPIGSVSLVARKWLDKPFFEKALALFDEAEKLAAGNPAALQAIGQERLPVDIYLLYCGDNLNVAFDKKAVAERTSKNLDLLIKKYVIADKQAQWKTSVDGLMRQLSGSASLPARFDGLKIKDFTPASFSYNGVQADVKDPDAVDGHAIRLTDTKDIGKEIPPDFHTQPLIFSIYDEIGKKGLVRKVYYHPELPRDEKYHWYYIGTTHLTERTLLALHNSWWITQKTGYSVYNPNAPQAKYAVFAEIKLTGPAYVPGSKQPDAVWVDRIVYVIDPPDDIEARISAEPLPEQFTGRKCVDFPAKKFGFSEVQQRVSDEGAFNGDALCFSDLSGLKQDTPADLHKQGMVFYIYDKTAKKALIRKALTGPEFPKDEKYHWMNIGTTALCADCVFAAHSSWWVTQGFPTSAFDAKNPGKEYEVWVSFKLTGPSYVPGSTKKDALYIDRVIFAEKAQ